MVRLFRAALWGLGLRVRGFGCRAGFRSYDAGCARQDLLGILQLNGV